MSELEGGILDSGKERKGGRKGRKGREGGEERKKEKAKKADGTFGSGGLGLGAGNTDATKSDRPFLNRDIIDILSK